MWVGSAAKTDAIRQQVPSSHRFADDEGNLYLRVKVSWLRWSLVTGMRSVWLH